MGYCRSCLEQNTFRTHVCFGSRYRKIVLLLIWTSPKAVSSLLMLVKMRIFKAFWILLICIARCVAGTFQYCVCFRNDINVLQDYWNFASLFIFWFQKNESFDIGELLATIDKHQLDDIWANLQRKATTALLSLENDEDDNTNVRFCDHSLDMSTKNV